MQVATLFCKNSNPLSGGTNNMMESPTTSSSSASPASAAALSATALLLSTSHIAPLSPTVATTPTAPAVPVIPTTITDATTTSSSSPTTNARIITETESMDVVKENTTGLVVNTAIDVVREDNSVEQKIIADQSINNIVSNENEVENEVENEQNEFHSSQSFDPIKTESVSELNIGISTETNNTMNENDDNDDDGDMDEHQIEKNHEIDAVVPSDDLEGSVEINIVKMENGPNIEGTPPQITDCSTTDENKCSDTVNSFYDGLSLTASSPPSVRSPVDMDNKDNSNSLKSFDSVDHQSSIMNEKLNDENELLNSVNDDNAMNVVNNHNEKNDVDANSSMALVDDVNNSENDKFGANTDNSNTNDNKLNLNIDIDMDNSNTNNNDSFKNNNLNNNDHSNEISQSAVQYFQNQINRFSPPLDTSASTNTTEPPDLGSHESMVDCEDNDFNKL